LSLIAPLADALQLNYLPDESLREEDS
jgi:hypothetical protein